jgi:hypothetical protein
MVSAKEAEHILRHVKDDRSFRLHMGTSIRSLKELSEALDIMADRTFHHHVTEARNDFSNWVKDVLGDEELAEGMRRLRGREAILKRVDDRVEELEKKMSESHVTTKELMSMGAVDFVIGMIIGFIGGLVLAMMVSI